MNRMSSEELRLRLDASVLMVSESMLRLSERTRSRCRAQCFLRRFSGGETGVAIAGDVCAHEPFPTSLSDRFSEAMHRPSSIRFN